MNDALKPDERRELAQRASGGIQVTLYWSVRDHSASVEVWQEFSNERLLFHVEAAHALDAFYHPFAHLPLTEELVPAPCG